jgi:D-lactate dehydrogenase (cytochrome)
VQELGDEDLVSTDPDDLHAHGYSSWSSVNPDNLPVAVAYPRSTKQVAAIARICHKHRVPIIPYSGGSSLEGNFSAPYGGVSIDFAYMDHPVQQGGHGHRGAAKLGVAGSQCAAVQDGFRAFLPD